jgi:hypothetical protein
VNEHNVLSRVATLTRSHLAVAGVALALGTLTSCNGSDSSPNLPVIVPVPNSIAVANLNGAPDLVVATTADEGGALNPGYADVIMNTPGSLGTFQKGVHYATTGTNPSSIAVADLTGTGAFDLAIANFGNGSVSVFLQATPGTYNAAVDVPTGGQPNQVIATQLAGKGKGGFALVLADMSSSGNVIVLPPDTANPGKFLAPIKLPTGLTTPSVAAADLTAAGTGRPAIVAATFDSAGNNGAVQIFRPDPNNPSGFLPAVTCPAGAQPQSVKIADVNGDGLPDIIVANLGPGNDGNGSAGVSVLLQDATQPCGFKAPVTYTTPGQSIDVAVADLNNDNKPDLVVANLLPAGTGSVSVLLQTNAGAFGPATNYPALGQPLGVAIADLNQDGHPDIAIADGPSAGVLMQDAASPGTFSPVVQVGF